MKCIVVGQKSYLRALTHKVIFTYQQVPHPRVQWQVKNFKYKTG